MFIHDDYNPAIPIHPGEILQEELAARGWTQKQLAATMGRPLQLVNNIIHGRAGISAETALDLAEVFETSAQFWMNLDSQYRLAIARRKRAEKRVS
jgi:HTH-type transcriptional regulator/antitoxin HigA